MARYSPTKIVEYDADENPEIFDELTAQGFIPTGRSYSVYELNPNRYCRHMNPMPSWANSTDYTALALIRVSRRRPDGHFIESDFILWAKKATPQEKAVREALKKKKELQDREYESMSRYMEENDISDEDYTLEMRFG